MTSLTEVWEGDSGVWTEDPASFVNILAADITPSIYYGDILGIALDCDDGIGTVESGWYSYPNELGTDPLVNLGISTTLFPSFLMNYKTSHSADGVQIGCQLVFSDATTQTILSPTYSTTWARASGTLTANKTLDHIRILVTSEASTPNGIDYDVYCDFVLIHRGTFTFPYWHNVYYDLWCKAPSLEVFGRDGDIEQRGGMKSPTITVEGTMDYSDTGSRWKDAPSTSSLAVRSFYGNRFYEGIRGMLGDYRTPWNWFTSDLVNCKVVPTNHPLRLSQQKDLKEQRKYSLHFKQFSLSSLGEADWDELEWAGQ